MGKTVISKVTTPVFQVSFPSVFEKNTGGEGKPAYEVTMLFDKKSNLKEMKALLMSAAKKRWGDKIPKITGDQRAFKDQGEKEYEGYVDGNMFAKAKSLTRRPGVIDKQGNTLDDEDFYAGCYARATVTAYAYPKPGGTFAPGVSFGLSNIIKIKDGERFDGGTDASEDFDDLIEDAEPDTNQNDEPIEDDDEGSIF